MSMEALKRLGFSSYRDYLASPNWQRTRSRYYQSKLYKGRCYACGCSDKPLEIHHKSYKRLGWERLHDLVALCRECHQATHNFADRTGELWKASRKMKVAIRKNARANLMALGYKRRHAGHLVRRVIKDLSVFPFPSSGINEPAYRPPDSRLSCNAPF
jgi:hypothetical protein